MIIGITLVTMLAPTVALAHSDGRNENDDENSDHGWKNTLNWPGNGQRNWSGTVSATSTTGFDLKLDDGTILKINTANAKIKTAWNGDLKLSDIKLNSNAKVKGKMDESVNNQVNAKKVTVTPPNTHRAEAKGTVTAINGSNITIESQHRGVEYAVNITTDGQTQFKNSNSTSTATATLADVHVGSKISVKGLWDEIVNVLKAIKIRIR